MRKTYIPIFGIGGKQIDLLLEHLVIKKTLAKLWDEEATLKSLLFFLDLILWLLLYSVLTAGILLWYTYRDLEDNARSLCSIWLYVRSLRLPCCLSVSVWLSLFSLWCRKIEPILWLKVTAHLCARFSLPLTITLMFEPHCRLLPTLSGKHLFEKLLLGSNEKKFGHC